MNKKIVFFFAASAFLLAVSGCGAPAAKTNQRSAPIESGKPVMNSFGVSQEPVPAPPPPPVEIPAPPVETATSTPEADMATSTPEMILPPAPAISDLPLIE
jgi:hypothetical protein